MSTDAGAWADRHFDAVLRESALDAVPVATLLTARLPARALRDRALILLSRGAPLETDLASAARLPIRPSAPRGTAAARTP